MTKTEHILMDLALIALSVLCIRYPRVVGYLHTLNYTSLGQEEAEHKVVKWTRRAGWLFLVLSIGRLSFDLLVG